MLSGHVRGRKRDNYATSSLIDHPTSTNGVNGTHVTHSGHLDTTDEPAVENGASKFSSKVQSGAETGSKKRKYGSISNANLSSRPLSPPWKKIGVEGPTTLIIDGKRKSGRHNVIPLEMQPANDQRRTRAAASDHKKPRPSYAHLHNGTSSEPKLKKIHSKSQAPRERQSTSLPKAPSQPQFKKPPHPIIRPAEHKSPKRNRSSSSAGSRPSTLDKDHHVSVVTKTRLSRHADGASSAISSIVSKSAKSNGYHGDLVSSVPAPARFQRLKLRVREPILVRRHPHHYPPKRLHDAFDEFLRKDNPLDGEGDTFLTGVQAIKEARIRIRIARAAEPGGILSKEECTRFADTEPEDIPARYGHWNYLVTHALHFRKLLLRERTAHQKLAKHVAVSCQQVLALENRWAFLREAKSAEEIHEEERGYQIKRYHQVAKDMSAKWRMVSDEVVRIRQHEWRVEQEARGAQALDEMLDQTNLLLNQNRSRECSEFQSESADRSSAPFHSDAGNETERGGDSVVEIQSENDENMSESSEEEGDTHEDDHEDEILSPEALRRKYASLPRLELSESSESSSEDENNEGAKCSEDETLNGTPNTSTTGKNDAQHHTQLRSGTSSADVNSSESDAEAGALQPPELEEVDSMLLDASDESTDMDSDVGTDSDDNATGSEEESEIENNLLGFYGKGYAIESKPKLNASFDSAVEVIDAGERHVNASSPHSPDRSLSKTNCSHFADLSIEATSADDIHESASETPQTPSTQPKTEVPTQLLRGSLREYQHTGLDWLARLYRGGRNGILADEMGLGKTIQTIALLAHLAVSHEIWGPHLIVVPTSVILNWEREFKKFCPGLKILTYFGTLSERKEKRNGWLDENKWNVVITSYQLIVKDAQAFKRRNWHYLILDEAHNIKNFKSLRWRTMLSFKTHSRLLLTGTPLQNSLQELWSLLYFLMPGGIEGAVGFADMETFLNSMKRPADQILDQGRQELDAEAQKRVSKLHEILRPFLLRRLKSEVEKEMPGKYEHVVYCRLSKRQRQLYDEFMGRSTTRQSLSSGNYMSIMNCLMSLRKVCNHPDLFETRQIVTSFAMPKSVVADFETKELLVRRKLFADAIDLEYCGLVPTAHERHSRLHSIRRDHLKSTKVLQELVARHNYRINASTKLNPSTTVGALAHVASETQLSVLAHLQNVALHAKQTVERWPIYGTDLVKLLTMPSRFCTPPPTRRQQMQGRFDKVKGAKVFSMGEWYLDQCTVISEMMPSLEQQAAGCEILVRKFGCITPAVVAEDVTRFAITPEGMELVRKAQQFAPSDPYHEGRIRLSIAFPDKRLLQYDCGKLQRLDSLLRQLQAGGHRCLIFTQMTKVLDVLEQFLNIHGHRYLRLDGSTKIEQRQLLTDRFNQDDRILAFILSSRSGGLGINLTGADTVIFYDLDWNPAMDAQCQDRAHRIGQTREVHIYRFVSEYTIEANILRKSNQKRLLDDVIIQKGEFTTDCFNRVTYKDAFEDTQELEGENAEASAAIDRVLGEATGLGQVLEAVEDIEDTAAAKAVQKEMTNVDDVDFNESTQIITTPRASVPQTPIGDLSAQTQATQGEEEYVGHVDDYMIRVMMEEYKNVVFVPKDAIRKKNKKGRDYRKR